MKKSSAQGLSLFFSLVTLNKYVSSPYLRILLLSLVCILLYILGVVYDSKKNNVLAKDKEEHIAGEVRRRASSKNLFEHTALRR